MDRYDQMSERLRFLKIILSSRRVSLMLPLLNLSSHTTQSGFDSLLLLHEVKPLSYNFYFRIDFFLRPRLYPFLLTILAFLITMFSPFNLNFLHL